MAELDHNVEQSRDDVAIFIKNKLQEMAPFVPEYSIHRVPKQLFNMNPSAYTPIVISIGPFHRDQHKFKHTEELKVRFFNSFQCRVGMSVEEIVENAQGWESKARQYYSEPINMSSEEFVKMMILDGCFIVELMVMEFKDHLFSDNENKVHPSLYVAIKLNMSVELIMLENQLPFFILQNLFDLVYPTRSKDSCYLYFDNIGLFKVVVHNFLKWCVFPIKDKPDYNRGMSRSPHHLLDFLSSYFSIQIKAKHEKVRCLPPSATQLNEAGIVFKKFEHGHCLMDIRFKNGILKIPPLQIDGTFEIFARNLLAFAQFSCEEKGRYAIHYFQFLDELISTEKDVNLLVNKGIIMNRIGGSEKELAQLFNSICKNITVDDNNYYRDIAKVLEQHCERRQNRWMASLKHNYFNSPWALISFMAATFLIFLTLLQTIFTSISFFQ